MGAGLVIGGRTFRGSAGFAGEIGHTAIDPRGPRCRCGLNGCLEALVGARSLVRMVEERIASGEPSVLAQVQVSPGQIAMAARADDALAQAVLAEAGVYLGTAVANLVNLINPARVVLGGSLPVISGEHLLQPMRQAIRSRALGPAFDATEVVVSSLGEDAVVVGAATKVLEACLNAPVLLAGPSPHVPHQPAAASGL